MVRERKGKSKPKVEEVPVEPETLEVPGPPKRDLFKREKSPFEVGDRKELQVASSHAIIDKASVMDISGGACSVAGKMDEYISLLFTDYCSLDKASCEDISEVKIVIIEEEEIPIVIEPDVDVAAEEEARKQAELEEARRQRRIEEEADEERRRAEAEEIKRAAEEAAAAIVAAEAEAKRLVEEAAKKKIAEEEAIAKKAEEEAIKNAEAAARKIAEEEKAAAEAAAIAEAEKANDSDDELIPVKEEVDPSDWEAVEEEAPLIPAVLADLIAERELAAEEGGEEVSEKEMTEKDRDLEWQRQRQMMRPPLVISHLKSRAVPKNSVAKLTCNVTGPGIMVRWLKNGNPIEINPSKYKFFNSEGLLSLEILNTRTKDAAEYTCFIKNKNGETSTVASLQVYDSIDTERPVPPTFVSIKGNLITVKKFKLYKVNCKCLKRNAKVLNNNSKKEITDSHVKLCKIMFNVLFNTKKMSSLFVCYVCSHNCIIF